MKKDEKVAVVIPCFKVKAHILNVIQCIGIEVARIYVIDDACPESTGLYVESSCVDPRVTVIYHSSNKGVGGAVITGYQRAINDDMDIIVKIDGDGQMDPRLIGYFIEPIVQKEADYTKGNRFFDLESIRAMPKVRLIGNAGLSFLTKISSGYWNIFDPTNGYTAINAKVISHLPMSKISNRYFFESDMLFRLGLLRAVVVDIPMDSKYEDEVSNLKIQKVFGQFLRSNIKNTFKRLVYNYYLRDMSIASIELPLGILLVAFGATFGVVHWIGAETSNVATPSGTVMLAALPVILGFQFILAFLNYDIGSVPKKTISNTQSVKNKSIGSRGSR